MAFDVTSFVQEEDQKRKKSAGAFDVDQFVNEVSQDQGLDSTVGKSRFNLNSFMSSMGIAPKADLTTVPGLQQTAELAGYGAQAQQLTQNQGEDPKQIFSGGVISDIFDGLNLLQYGVTGVLKGKTFLEGVKTRQSFADQDALGDQGIPGVIAGIALDIAVDPLTYIGGLGLIGKAGKVSKLEKVAAGVGKAAQKVPGVERASELLGRMFIYRFGQDPIYQEIAERTTKNIAVGNQNLLELVKPLTTLDPEVQRAVGAARKQGVFKAATGVPDQLQPFAEQARKFVSPEDFASELGTTTSKQMGIMDAKEIAARDPVEKTSQHYLDLKNDILKNGIQEPVRVTMENGKLLTTEGSHRVTIAQELGLKIPVIVNAGEVKGLSSVADFYHSAVKGADAAAQGVDLPEEILAKARPAFHELDRLGKEAVEVGLLKADTYEANLGTYMARLYTKHEIPEGIPDKIKSFFGEKPQRIDLSRFKARTDIPEDVRAAMGEILEAGYPTAKSLVQLNSAIERAKMFKDVAGKFAGEAGEGMVKLADARTLGDLAGKFVPKFIADDINEITRVKGDFEKLQQKIVGGFKFGKVVLNPATHARNIMSNFILNDFAGMSVLNPKTWLTYAESAKELATKGEWYQEARKVGLGLDSFAAREIKDMLIGPEAKGLTSGVRGALKKAADLYEGEEQFAKLSQYIFQRRRGLAAEDAWKMAEQATFNYAQVTPFIRRMRESIFGFPFITFSSKATPAVAKTIVTHPERVSKFGKFKNAVERQSNQEELAKERSVESSWMKSGYYMKLPVKDEHGRSAYLDLTYIIPFGDLLTGQFTEQSVDRDTGLPQSPAETALGKSPALNVIKELAKNEDFYGNKIWKDSDSTAQQLADVARHLITTYAPAPVASQLPGGYSPFRPTERRPGALQRSLEAEQRIAAGEIEGSGTQIRTPMQEFIRNIGLKVSPVDAELQEKYSQNDMEKALNTFLKERGIIKEFSRNYQPKKQ